jgi:hypothetical protein
MRGSAAGVMWRRRNVPLPEMQLLAIGFALPVEFGRNRRILTPSRSHRVAAMGVVAAGLGAIVWAVGTWERLDIARPSRVVTTGRYSTRCSMKNGSSHARHSAEYARYSRRTGRYVSWPGWRD